MTACVSTLAIAFHLMQSQPLFLTFTLLALLSANFGCTNATSLKPAAETTAPPAVQPAQIVALHPAGAVAGVAFNRQPNGNSAIAITTRNANSKSTIHFGGRALATIFGGPELLSAEVPADLIATPGTREVAVVDGQSRSNSFAFELTAK